MIRHVHKKQQLVVISSGNGDECQKNHITEKFILINSNKTIILKNNLKSTVKSFENFSFGTADFKKENDAT